MYVRKKKYPSGNVGIIVVEKVNGKMRELVTIGIAKTEDEAECLVTKGKEWIDQEQQRRQLLCLLLHLRIEPEKKRWIILQKPDLFLKEER